MNDNISDEKPWEGYKQNITILPLNTILTDLQLVLDIRESPSLNHSMKAY